MTDRAELAQMLDTAKMVLTVLETQAAGYTNLTIPAHLKVQLDEKRQEVTSIEARLAQLQGSRNAATVPDNLPRYSGVFVGRKDEMARCLEALTPEERGWGAVIDGLGGMGKTALALEVAHLARKQALFDAYLFASAKTTWLTPEGVRQETLALSSLDAFCREFARILGQGEIVQMADATERRRALLEALRGRRALLIWDNLETLTADERDQIAEFVRKLPSPNKAILTSRRRTGESALMIRLDQLSLAEALQLMQEKGRLAPALAEALQATDDADKRNLYEMAGGNPLALDWTLGLVAQKGYSLTAALGRLRDAVASDDLYGFLFTDVARDLQPSDRAVLSALTVFQAPATLNALMEVTELATPVVTTALGRLLILSLVSQMEGQRYSIHPLTRAYVETALRASKEGVWTTFQQFVGLKAQAGEVQLSPKAQRKALRYWVDYAQKYGGQGKDAYKTFDKLEAEWQTLEGIANTLRELSGLPGPLQDREAAQMLIDLEDALRSFLLFRGYWDEQIRLGEWSYQAGQALGNWRDAGWGAQSVAWIHYNRAETDRAATWADRMATAMEWGGSRHDRAVAAQMQGGVAQQRRDCTEAERHYQAALAAYRELQAEASEAIVLNDLGEVARQQQQSDRAETYYRQALAIDEKRGHKQGQAVRCGNLGLLALARDRPPEARPWFERSLTLAQEVGRQDLVADAQSGLAQVLEAEGHYAEALEQAQQALQIQERLRDGNVAVSRAQVERLQRRVGG
jgi:tetratricopeptide (TPR) repeat protein